MSQNALLRGNKGPSKGPSLSSKTQDSLATNHNNNTNNITANKSTKHKQQSTSDEIHAKKNLEPKEISSQPLKPTADQVRIAQLTAVNKSEDPEIIKKIKEVQDIVPNRVQDEILMVLHENDYDIEKTINYFLEGGSDLTQDWKTAGIKTNKNKTNNLSPNQTLEDTTIGADDLGVQTTNNTNSSSTTKSHRQQNNAKQDESNNHNRESVRSRDRNRAKVPGKAKAKLNDSNGVFIVKEEGDNLEERFVNSMDLNRDNNNNNGEFGNRKRGAPRGVNGTNNYRGGGGGSGGGGSNGSGGGRRGRNSANQFRQSSGGKTQRNKDDAEAYNNEVGITSPTQDDKLDQTSPEDKLKESTNDDDSLTEKKYSNVARADNLRDIGTWSNEQADKNQPRSASSNAKQATANANNRSNSRFNTNSTNGKNQQTGNVNNTATRNYDDLENDEEWQGDLTQTQIFTASAQKTSLENSEFNRANPAAGMQPSGAQQQQFDSNFPIGHFNAEEAAQKIKNAVGIGSSTTSSTSSLNKKVTTNSTMPSSTTTTSALTSTSGQSVNNTNLITSTTTTTSSSDDAQSKEENKQPQPTVKSQQPTQNYKPIKFGSVKPPPPSTKIPKSAVVMPDGSSTNGFSLDVQFGVDLDTPLDSKESIETKVTDPIGKKLNMVSPQVIPTNIQHQTQQQVAPTQTKPAQTQNLTKSTHQPSASTTTSSVSSASSLGAFTSSNSSIEKVTNVGVVNPVINSNSSSVQANSSAKLLNNDSSIVGVGTANSTKLDNQTNAAHTVPQQQQQQQQPLMSHNIDIKKMNQQNQFQQQINNLNRQQPKHQQYDSNLLGQHQQNLIQQRDTNQQQNANVNNQHYQQQHQQQQQQHHHQQLNVNSNMNSQMKDSSSSQNLAQAGNASGAAQLLNISPQNINNKANTNQASNAPLNQQQQQQQLLHQNSTNTNNNNGLNQAGLNQNVNAAVAAAVKNTMPPPPGVNFNPNNQFLMSLPFVCYDQQNFPYFDTSQLDGNNIIQMYNHLGLGVPPGVTSAAPTAAPAAGATPGAPPYSIADSKFARSEPTNSNSQLNANVAQLSQQQQPQQQQPINLIPGLSNFPYFFPNYYPNMFMSMPNGPQANPQFQNKPPYNFNNNAAYDDQNKDYSNYNPQGQIKTPGSNLNNVPEIASYQKNVDKTNTGYHTPPPNYSNSALMNQQQHPNVSATSGAPPPPAQFAHAYMIGAPNNPLVHTGLQQDNTRNNSGASNMKTLQKNTSYPNPWN